MSHNYTGVDGERTEIGTLEYRAKQCGDKDAVTTLARQCVDTIKDFPLYNDADLVCAVPPRPGKNFDLPSALASRVGVELGKGDITHHFSFGSQKMSAKSATLDDKWAAWEAAQLAFNGTDITDKRIILIDDKYQSGTTIQYIAMKLQEAGAGRIYGLCVVKTMRDTDNR